MTTNTISFGVFSMRRLLMLVKKEWLQMSRDPSIFVIALILPVMLVLLFGYGLSMDLKHVPTAVVLGESTPMTVELSLRFKGSDYFDAIFVPSREEAEALMRARKIDAIVEMPAGFTHDAALNQAKLGVTIHGVDSSAAMIIRTYVAGTVQAFLAERQTRGDASKVIGTDSSLISSASSRGPTFGPVTIISRAWFNEANTSAWYLVPGLNVVILTLTCSFMGSLVIAREWERGTMESLCSTPAAAFEIVLSKFIVNLLLVSLGMFICFSLARWIFDVPVRGSLPLLFVTLIVYNAWAMSFGLFLSAVFKVQFVAIQMAVIGSYLPALILSGYLFDLRSVPRWISLVGHLMPPTYAIESVKILCLSGGPVDIVLSNLALLAAAAVAFFSIAMAATQKRLD